MSPTVKKETKTRAFLVYYSDIRWRLPPHRKPERKPYA